MLLSAGHVRYLITVDSQLMHCQECIWLFNPILGGLLKAQYVAGVASDPPPPSEF